MNTSDSQGLDAGQENACGTDGDPPLETNKRCDELAPDTAGKSNTHLRQGITNLPKFKANRQKRPLYHVAVKHTEVTDKAKTTEERELEKIKQMQLELKKHREMAQKSLRMVQHSAVHLPLKSTCMPTLPVGFNFCTDGRIKRHATKQPALGVAQGRDKAHSRSRKSIAVAKCWQQAASSRLAGGLPVLKRKREGGDAGGATNSCMLTRLKSRMTAPQTRGKIHNPGEPSMKKTKINAPSQRNALQRVQPSQPLTTNNKSTVSRGGNARPAPSTRHPVVPTKAGQPGGSRPPRPAAVHCLNRETKDRVGPPGKSTAKNAPADKFQSKVHKANPIRRYKKMEVSSSDKPLTSPVSPKFSTRFNI